MAAGEVRAQSQLVMENDLLKIERPSGAILHRERPDGLSIRRGCQLMNLARSTYYYRPKGPGKDEEALIARIETICAEFPRYGYRRVTAQLHHEGQRVNHKRVARIMRERGLSVKPRRQAVRTSDGACREVVFPNRGPATSCLAARTNCGSATSPTFARAGSSSTWR